MNRLELIRQALAAPWAVRPDRMPALVADLRRLAQDEIHPADDVEPVALDDLVEGSVAVIPMYGLLLQHPGMFGGGGVVTFTEAWGQAFDRLVVDPSVAAIVIDQDTPGGTVAGTPELSDKIHAARGTKPILSVANAFSASAGYWIGTAADRMFVTRSAQVGSIGVLIAHTDHSGLLEQLGLDVSLIHSGEFKTEGNPFEPLSDEAREELTRVVDETHEQFLADVARNRGVSVDNVRERFGRGRMVLAEEAVDRGMVDGVATLEEVIAEAARLAGVPAIPALEGRARGPQLEVRSLHADAATAEGDWPLVGRGVPYGRESRDMGGWREMFEPGAFGSLAGDIRVIWQHDSSKVLGRTKAGTARVWDDHSGVRYAAKPPDAQWARDAMESVRRGDVDRSSIGFQVPKGGARWERRDGYDLRIVSRARMVELGPQTYPAYENTNVATREHAAFQVRRMEAELEEIEAELGIA